MRGNLLRMKACGKAKGNTEKSGKFNFIISNGVLLFKHQILRGFVGKMGK